MSSEESVVTVAMTRRAVLATGTGAVVLAGLGQGSAEAAVTAPLRSHYARSVGRVFVLRRGRVSVRARLVAIRDLSPVRRTDRPTCFTLVFEPLRGRKVGDGIYAVRRPGVPVHRLFVSTAGSGRRMQAVVNRPRR
jgi:hypothetical protein